MGDEKDLDQKLTKIRSKLSKTTTKKERNMEDSNKTDTRPQALSTEDVLRLDNAALRLQLANQHQAAAKRDLDELQASIRAKYEIGPSDRVDGTTFAITRA